MHDASISGYSYLMTTTNETNTVAATILAQLGGRALYMLGAQMIVTSDDGVQFAIRGSQKASKIVIKHDAASDTYTVSFWKGRGLNIRQVSEVERVYVDSLHRVIESATGLYTSL